jgi:hypothetical protein
MGAPRDKTPRRRRNWAPSALACLAIGLLLLSLGACTEIELALGLRTRLDQVPVTSISASLSPGPALAPGGKARLVITASSSDGKKLVTVGPGHGEVLFDSFKLSATVAQVDPAGHVTLPADPRASQGQTGRIHIVTNGHPDVVTDLDVPVRYDVAYTASFSGAAGARGFDGSSGFDGMDGSSGSMDPNNPSPGGNGTNGGDGHDGDNGGPGSPGEAVQVSLRLLPGPTTLLQAKVAGQSHEALYLVDPQGGSLAVEANGGPGGSGGSGGRGGRGGSGGIGSPSGSSGLDGRNGFDGSPGAPGAPGSITVTVDPAAALFLDRLHLSNHSGNGAPGAPPVIQVQSVAPLW